VNSSGAVTLAGTTYSNLVSNLSYLQALPDNGTAGHREFLFATNLWTRPATKQRHGHWRAQLFHRPPQSGAIDCPGWHE